MMGPRVVCMICKATLHEGTLPASHGIGPCCEATYRAANGLAPRPAGGLVRTVTQDSGEDVAAVVPPKAL